MLHVMSASRDERKTSQRLSALLAVSRLWGGYRSEVGAGNRGEKGPGLNRTGIIGGIAHFSTGGGEFGARSSIGSLVTAIESDPGHIGSEPFRDGQRRSARTSSYSIDRQRERARDDTQCASNLTTLPPRYGARPNAKATSPVRATSVVGIGLTRMR